MTAKILRSECCRLRRGSANSQGRVIQSKYSPSRDDWLIGPVRLEVDQAVWLEVSRAVLVERSRARSRSDDDLAVVQRRIDNLEEFTKPLQDYYG